jgi:signal transduction histidine kinase
VRFEQSVEGAPDPASLDEVFSDLTRIVFELVRNAVRHGAPTKVEVHLHAADCLAVRVGDDGRGFREADVATSQGGLGNVRRRVEDLSGTMAVTSDAGGTRVEIRLPTHSNEASAR